MHRYNSVYDIVRLLKSDVLDQGAQIQQATANSELSLLSGLHSVNVRSLKINEWRRRIQQIYLAI